MGDNLGGRTPLHHTCATPLRNDGFRTPLHDGGFAPRSPQSYRL